MLLRQTDTLTDRQTYKHADRQMYFAAPAHRPNNTVCRGTVLKSVTELF